MKKIVAVLVAIASLSFVGVAQAHYPSIAEAEFAAAGQMQHDAWCGFRACRNLNSGPTEIVGDHSRKVWTNVQWQDQFGSWHTCFAVYRVDHYYSDVDQTYSLSGC